MMSDILWRPSAARVTSAAITALMAKIGGEHGIAFAGYHDFHRWTVRQPETFWRCLWDECGVIGERGNVVLRDAQQLPGAKWFPEARLNYAENLLRERAPDSEVIVFRGEDGRERRLSYRELYDAVSRCAQMFVGAGVEAGDRIAAYMPNCPEVLIAMLAATSLGAIFSSASPDFGARGVLDRFRQIGPKVLITVDGYRYGGKEFPILDKTREVVLGLPTLRRVVVARYLNPDGAPAPSLRDELAHGMWWDAAMAPFHAQRISFRRVPFDHPLFILYSSGTTGVPKCIVHGHGGTLLQHLKEHRYHCDVRRGDRVFYYTTCGWMMWNWLSSMLASEATLLLYDGSPFHPRTQSLLDHAASERCTFFGTSPRYLAGLQKALVRPRQTHDLSALRTLMSTGSPLAPELFDYVYEEIKEDVHLANVSGGTDIIACFVAATPTLPVRRGELQCPALGMDVKVFDENARAITDRKGELVCANAFPSLPLGFWNDPAGEKYRATYFARFPGVWTHGDWAEETSRGGYIIAGRSDATLNPSGIRIGTAEIYRQVDAMSEIIESVVVAQEWQSDVRIVLFVVLRAGHVLDDRLIQRIKERIRGGCTPRHVPAKILQVLEVPRTKSGKVVELAVRDIIHGRAVANAEALANPHALEQFRNLPELRS